MALQWDVCHEVIAWEGYYEPGPVDFRKETIAELIAIGDGVTATIELGYHLCYGSPADDHVIQPKDAGIMVEIVNAVSTGVRRPIQFFHVPVPKPRTDDAYFAPLAGLKLRPETELYLGLVHRDDMAGNAARLAAARSHVRVDGVATECGMARGDPERFPARPGASAALRYWNSARQRYCRRFARYRNTLRVSADLAATTAAHTGANPGVLDLQRPPQATERDGDHRAQRGGGTEGSNPLLR